VRQKARQQRLELLAVLGFKLLVVFVALVASAVIADTIGVKFNAGKGFGENTFGAKTHGKSKIQLTVTS
jgi:hypothetical protein